jgi:hypothetical protein
VINPFKKKKEPNIPEDIMALIEQIEEDPTPIMDNFSRELLFDAKFENPLKVAALLGLPPISEELAVKEQEESDKRIKKVSWLIPLFQSVSNLVASGIIVESIAANEDDFPDEFYETLQHRLESVCMAALLSTVSTLVDVELVKIGELDG